MCLCFFSRYGNYLKTRHVWYIKASNQPLNWPFDWAYFPLYIFSKFIRSEEHYSERGFITALFKTITSYKSKWMLKTISSVSQRKRQLMWLESHDHSLITLTTTPDNSRVNCAYMFNIFKNICIYRKAYNISSTLYNLILSNCTMKCTIYGKIDKFYLWSMITNNRTTTKVR